MVRTARKKVANLKAEELLDKSDQDIIQKKERDNTEVKQILQNDIQESVELDQELELLEKRLKQLTKAEKNSHRRNEDYDLLVADMEYLKKKIDLLIQERDEKNSQSTVQASSMNMASAAGEGASSVSGGDSSASGGTAAEADTGAAPGGAGSASSVPAAAGTGFSESV